MQVRTGDCELFLSCCDRGWVDMMGEYGRGFVWDC